MSGLGHYLEDEGVPTVQISLVREHTEKMRAPRALFVPFMLGRPLGVPDDAAFQKRVLHAALSVMEAPSGPIIVDHAEEAPVAVAANDDEEGEGWVCPISFGKPQQDDSVAEVLRKEAQHLRVWYDLGMEKRGGRTTFGVAGMEIDAVVSFLSEFATGGTPANPTPDIPFSDVLKYCCDDLRVFYYEAAEAQPGNATPEELGDWFWDQTTAGEVVMATWRICKDHDDPLLKRASRVLVPHPRQAVAAERKLAS